MPTSTDNTDKFHRPNRPYHLEPYDPEWASLFARLADELKTVLGDQAVRIEHMGSTAVPGMIAKPQIDILIEAKALDTIPRYYQAMQAAGYEPKGDYTLTGEEYFTKDNPDGSRMAGVHIYPLNHPEIPFQVKFRDYLRAHPAEVAAYSRLKKGLLAAHPEDRNAYGAGKRPYLDELRKRVAAWNPPR